MAAFGLLIFATDFSIGPAELARAAEAQGFESLFVPEHTHIPASRRSPWPGGAELPKEYWHTHDPFVSLTVAASVTSTLKVGTGIALVTERDPILMAKQAASLDYLSGGRLLLGVGAGWNAEEMEHHGTRFADRWKVLREHPQELPH
jgi:alkanesulfonate monooxygenase SsuD/methylene tetrahydromethanopterin reductase-like flavin-dependent oxidoreductase (luciferase family)